jgi:predicted nucleic acid-binding protein
MNPILIDTNLLVYVFDQRDAVRQAAAIQVVGSLAKLGSGRLSAQCLSEFFSAVTRQKQNQAPILSLPDALTETEKLARAFTVYPVTQPVVLEALRGVRQYQFHFWDAQIWAAARLNQIPTVFSQDFQSGAVLEGVRFVDPLAAGFQLQPWVVE